MGRKPANFFETQYAEKFSFYKKQHVLDLFYNTIFQTGHPLVKKWSLHQTKNYYLEKCHYKMRWPQI